MVSMTAPPTLVTKPSKPGKNAASFDVIADLAQQTLSYVLFTVLYWDQESKLLRRIYSTHSDGWPVAGSKKMLTDAPWPQHVIVRKVPHFCPDRPSYQATFSDYQSSFDIGCHSQLSLPILDTNGAVLGAINLSGAEGVYTDETISQAQGLVSLARIAMLRWLDEERGVNS